MFFLGGCVGFFVSPHFFGNYLINKKYCEVDLSLKRKKCFVSLIRVTV